MFFLYEGASPHLKLLKLSKNRTAVYPPFPSMSSPPASCPVTFFCSFYAVFVYLFICLISSVFRLFSFLYPFFVFFLNFFLLDPSMDMVIEKLFFFFKEKSFGDKEARAFVKTE